MPESYVNVTEGAGKKLHTFQRTVGANNVEDEVVIPGEPYLGTFVFVFATAITLANAAGTQLIQVMAGAANNVYVRRVKLWQVGFAAAAGLHILDLYRVTTAPTGGSAIAGVPYDTADSVTATSAYLPGVAGTLGARITVGILPEMAAAGTAGMAPSLEWTFPPNGPKSLKIPAGAANGIVIRNNSGSTNATVIGEVVVSEANF